MTQSKIKTTRAKPITFRPKNKIMKLIEWYMQKYDSTKTQALMTLLELGGTVAVKKYYDDGGK